MRQRKSPRLKKENNTGKTIIKLAKKCGITKEDEGLDHMTL
jgi:hypothetical protein